MNAMCRFGPCAALIVIVTSALALSWPTNLPQTGAWTITAPASPEVLPMEQPLLGWDDHQPVLPSSCCKLAAAAADGRSCTAFESLAKDNLKLSPFGPVCRESDAGATSEKRVSVSTLVKRALQDQAKLLRGKVNELERWEVRDRAAFAHWFGRSDDEARRLVIARVKIQLQLNERYSVQNFRRAPRSEAGLFAFVRSNDPSKVFLGNAFVRAPTLGENSRAGVLVHEMSHFVIAGGTKDFAYGTAKCRALARSNPDQAMLNADNLEYYLENAR
jgi:hypothetical protein